MSIALRSTVTGAREPCHRHRPGTSPIQKPIIVLLTLTALAFAPSALAWTIDDVKKVVDGIVTQAKAINDDTDNLQARNTADRNQWLTPIRTNVDTINTKVGTLRNDVKSDVSALMAPVNVKLAALEGRISGIGDSFGVLRGDINGVVDRLVPVAQGLTALVADATPTFAEMQQVMSLAEDHVREEIMESFGEFRSELEDLRAEQADFVGGTPACDTSVCVQFVSDVQGLLADMAAYGTFISDRSGLRSSFMPDLSKFSDLIGRLPARALFPMYVALSVETRIAGPEVIGLLRELPQNLEQNLAQMGVPSPFSNPTPEEECAGILGDPAGFRTRMRRISKAGGVLSFAGSALTAMGETKVIDKGFGIWGFPDISIKNNHRKKIGTVLSSLGENASSHSNSQEVTWRFCTLAANQATILANQEFLIAGQAELLAAIGSGDSHKGNGHSK